MILFVKAIIAGWLIGLMVWMLPGARRDVPAAARKANRGTG